MMAAQSGTIKLTRNSENVSSEEDTGTPWVVLVIDDEQSVLDVTKNVLKRFRFMNRRLLIKSARSFVKAKDLYQQYPEAAVALIDCTMEQNTSGLDFVEFVRNEQKNTTIQLVLRTGQPGFAPERRVLLDYEINDYLAKTELTSTKLNARMISYLRSFESLKTIAMQNEELAKLNQIKDDFMTTVSHELTSPLKASNGILSLLAQTHNELSPQSLKYMQLLEGCNQQMEYLIKDLIDTTMIRRNKFRMSFSDQSLYSLTEEIMPNLMILSRYLYKQDSISVENLVDNDLPLVSLDKARIQQVIINLVTNALKFTKAGSVKITSSHEQGTVSISVVDTGIGIASKDLLRIFDAFCQSDVNNNLSIKGMGLGLFISNKIIKSHHGKIVARSDLGTGSEFTFTLPTL